MCTIFTADASGIGRSAACETTEPRPSSTTVATSSGVVASRPSQPSGLVGLAAGAGPQSAGRGGLAGTDAAGTSGGAPPASGDDEHAVGRSSATASAPTAITVFRDSGTATD